MGQKVRHRVTLTGKCRNELGGAIHVMWEGRVAVQRAGRTLSSTLLFAGTDFQISHKDTVCCCVV